MITRWLSLCVCVFTLLALLIVAGERAAAAMGSESSTDESLPPYQLLTEDVEQAVAEALVQAGVAEHVKATVTSNRKSVLYAAHHPVEVALNDLSHESRGQAWSAHMLIMKGQDVVSAQPLAGRYEEQRSLPVLLRRTSNGHIIREQDVVMKLFPVTKVQRNTITDPKQLIGFTPERTISDNRPIRSSELATPSVMKEGATVSMVYETPYMRISTVGEAMQDGGIGEYIRVRNPDSNKVVRARVVSSQEVVAGLGMGE